MSIGWIYRRIYNIVSSARREDKGSETTDLILDLDHVGRKAFSYITTLDMPNGGSKSCREKTSQGISHFFHSLRIQNTISLILQILCIMLGSSLFPAICLASFLSTASSFHANPSSAAKSLRPSTSSLSGAAETSVIDLLDSNFATLFHSEKPLLIDAYAPWCGPCRLIEPVVKNCAKKRSDSLVVSRWNVESLQTDVKIELLLQGANPGKLPTLILVHQGKATMIHSGLITEDQLDELLSEHLSLVQPVVPKEKETTASRRPSNVPSTTSERKSGFINFAKETVDDYMLSFHQ